MSKMTGTKRSMDTGEKGPSKKTKFSRDGDRTTKAKEHYRPEVYKKSAKPDSYLSGKSHAITP